MNLYPSLLTANIEEFNRQLAWVIDSQAIKVAQIDVIDGQFVENITLTPMDLVDSEFQELEIDFHFMTEEPMDFVHELIEIKDELPVRAVISQVERMSSQAFYLEELKAQGWQAGLSLDLFTPVSAIDERSWENLDIVQLMTIEAGFQGQKFNEKVLEKVAEIRQLADKNLEIIIDGGIKPEVIDLLHKYKIDGVTVGSGFWKAANPVVAIQQYSGLMS